MLAAIHTVEAFDPNLIPFGDWSRIKTYFEEQIEAERDRLDSYGDTDNRREMSDPEKLVFGTIMQRWLTCGPMSGPNHIRGICKDFGLSGYRF